MPLGIGITELLIVGVLALVVFGPKRLPEMGRSLGRGMREFKDSVGGDRRRDETEEPDELAFAYDDDALAPGSPVARAGAAHRP